MTCKPLVGVFLSVLVIAFANRMSAVCGVGSSDSGTTFARDAFEPYLARGELPGVISVFYDNGVQETACLGYADAAKSRRITLDDHYMQCSQTKGFCGVTAAILVEEGLLKLDDPVSKYLPEFRELWVETSNTNGVKVLKKAQNVLTVRMCLNHTGGLPFELPNYHAMGGWSRRMPLRSVAVMAAALPLMFEPGTKSNYSNVGIDIGAAVVEKVSGRRWEDFLKERVLDPLGMTATGFKPTNAQLADSIGLYSNRNGQKAEPLSQDGSMQRPYNDDRVFPSAGAGLWTTARDQLRFYGMLMRLGVGDNGIRILREETVKSLLAVSTRPKGLGGYSLGLIAPVTDGENEWFGHGGAFGTQCMVNWHRKQLRMLVVQSVGGGARFRAVNAAAADLFFGRRHGHAGAESE